MNIKKVMYTFVAGLVLSNLVHATTVTLKDGRSVSGEVVSHNSEALVIDVNGIKMTLPTDNIESIDMTSPEPEVVKETVKEVKTKTVSSSPMVVEAGSVITIKMSEKLYTRKDKKGKKFTAVLEANLMSGDTVVVPQGAKVYGVITKAKRAKRVAGKAELAIELTDISIDGTMHKIATESEGTKADGAGGDNIRRIARTAAIGGLIDGSDGAKTGAKVGAGLAVLTKGDDIEVPKGTLIDFVLRTPLKL